MDRQPVLARATTVQHEDEKADHPLGERDRPLALEVVVAQRLLETPRSGPGAASVSGVRVRVRCSKAYA